MAFSVVISADILCYTSLQVQYFILAHDLDTFLCEDANYAIMKMQSVS